MLPKIKCLKKKTTCVCEQKVKIVITAFLSAQTTQSFRKENGERQKTGIWYHFNIVPKTVH